MDSPSQQSGWTLLRDLEAAQGRLELHKEPASSDHGDPDWTRAAYGSWLEEWSDKVKAVRIPMAGDPVHTAMLKAAALLRPDLAGTIQNLAIGMTSIPILNACAIRRGDTLAIAMNHRLSNVFGAANAITWDMDAATIEKDEQKAKLAASRLQKVLAESSKVRFDLALSATNPWPTMLHFRVGAWFSNLQLLFVLLHELGHIVLGHLNDKTLWAGHPLTSSQFLFFNSSHEAEYQADRFAMDSIMQADRAIWAQAMAQFELPDTENIFPPQMILKLIGRLFFWFDIMAPRSRERHYAVPTSHPHPLDRMKAIFDGYPLDAAAR